MKTTLTRLAAIFAIGAIASSASAQAELDADGDGVLSYAEMVIGYPELTEEAFVQIDANEDGVVDAEELAAAKENGLIPA